MRLLVYASDPKQQKKVSAILAPIAFDEPMELLTDAGSLSRRLRQNVVGPKLLLLLIASQGELKRITRMAELMDGLRIILVLPDRCRETIALGHTLYPRFVSYTDGDLQDIQAVMDHILLNARTQKSPY